MPGHAEVETRNSGATGQPVDEVPCDLMRVIVAVLGVVATVGCQGRPARTRNDTPVVAPRDADAGRAATAVREVTKTAAADVTKAGVTSAGGSVWRIGEPRMRVTRHANGGLVVSLAAKRAVATDGGVVKIWELEHGTLVARISPAGPAPAAPAGDALSFLVMSPRATRLAVYRESGLAVYEAPFKTPLLTRTQAWPLGFAGAGL